jgi:hypothetical protein
MQHYVINFVSDMWQVGGFLRVLRFPPTNKTDRHDLAKLFFNPYMSKEPICRLFKPPLECQRPICRLCVKRHSSMTSQYTRRHKFNDSAVL